MKKKFLIFILVLVMSLVFIPNIASAANTTEFAGGSGTAKDPYLISTKTHLNNVRKYLDAHFKLTCDIVFTDADFAKGGAFYNNGAGWMPIGTKDSPFTGTFDGNGFAVKNLYVNVSDSADNANIYAGLFGYNKGLIKNLGIVDGNISAIVLGFFANANTGGVAGHNGGTIENCYNTGNISGSAENANAYVGGIAGYNFGAILGCYNTGITSATIETFYAFIGGIAGENYGDITDCHNTGTASAAASNVYSGGIVGLNEAAITGCYNTGAVSAEPAASGTIAFAGGIVGENKATITDSYNTGKVSATTVGFYAYAGGVTGYNHSSSTITGCYNTGHVSAMAEESYRFAYAGGIVGENEGTITDCYNTGAISSTSKDSTANAGGIVAGNWKGAITSCYNTGDVSATTLSSKSYYSANAGGIAGYNVGTLTNCYYLDTISLGIGNGSETATKCTATQMQTKSTYVGFDFTNTWDIDAESAYKYPVIHAFKTTTTQATLSKNGSIAEKCSVCGKVKSTTAIYRPTSFTLSTTSYTYNGSVKTPAVTVKDSAGKTLKKDTDYTVTYASGRKDVGTYTVTINGIGNYGFTKSLSFAINPIDISACKVSLSATSYTYNGSVKTPSVKIISPTGSTLTNGTSYTVSYASGRVNVGTYTVKVTMKGNYTGTKTLSFKINPVQISYCSISLSATSYTYNGTVRTPTVTVMSPGGSKLTKGISYTVSYASGRVNVGTYTVKVTMKGNYTGTKTLSFKINPIKASNCAMKLSTYTYTYDGKVKAPTVKITSPTGSTLTKGTSYTVSYEAGRRNAGTYKVTVTMKGNYTGTKTQSFKINPIKVSNCSVKLSTTAYTYNGKVKTPTVKVISPTGSTLTKGTSYTVTYASGRKNVGTYKVTVKMKGNYTGTKTLTFKISPPATTVSKLTAGSKSITIGITKKTSQVTGYQIQYSTSKTFSSATTKNISSYKTTSCTLKGLSARKTYYVRVRTFKTVNDIKYYSGWSAYKYVKTK